MNVRSLILALVAIVIAAGAALGVRGLISGNPTPTVVAAAPKEPEKMVLVAVQPLPTGHIIKIENLRWVAWPEDSEDTQFHVKGVVTEQSLAGKVIKVPVAQGAPLLLNQVVGPGERGFLAAVLGKDMRAVTVAVTNTSGVGGFVFPGDRVDLVLTHEVPNGLNNLPLRGAETILTNVRVLAVNDKTDDTGQVGAIPAVQSVTLEVPPPFVEEIAVMQRLGAISLSLRPITDSAIEAVASKDGAVKDPLKADTASTLAAKSDMEAPLIVPSNKERTLTVDRQVSKLVTLSRPAVANISANTVNPNPAPPKPDITVSRADQTNPVTFDPKTTGSTPGSINVPTGISPTAGGQ
jgi:pilus assembly protein CpaB